MAQRTPAPASFTPSPRQPRLVWVGRETRREAEATPAQTLEIVRPSVTTLATPDMAKPTLWPGADEAPQNRLIWTNDNLVALTSLLAGDAQHAPLEGQVDLIYIDPPFAVQSNFSVSVEIEQGLADEKLPTLVEELAYRDTWENGLDSYLSMLRDRLLLLKRLLKPTGSVYVHCDWHAGHYIKVLMDEVFSYDNFRNEIVWQRTSARSDSHSYNHIHDVIYLYSKSDEFTYNNQYTAYDESYLEDFYRHVEEKTGRRFRLSDLTAAGTRRGSSGQPWRGIDPAARGRHWAYMLEQLDELDQAGRIYWPLKKDGVPAYKRFLDEMPGVPLQSIWTDISPLAAQSAEKTNFTTQKPVALLQRIIAASSNPGDLVLDAFVGSGTTAVAAETMQDESGKPAPRRWIAIDCGKFAIHITRKRLIEAHARPFTVENIGFYSRADAWQAVLQKRPSARVYRDALIDIYGGEVVDGFTYLHGRKGDHWVHIGPLDAPISERQLAPILAEAAATDLRAIDILSADIPVDWNPNADEYQYGVKVYPKIIPQAAVEAVRQRLSRKRRKDPDIEAAPDIHFFSPPDIEVGVVLAPGQVTIKLQRLTIDLDDCLSTQDDRKRAQIKASIKEWSSLIDYWAVDWDWREDKPFENQWQTFRTRKQRDLTLNVSHRYEEHGEKRIAVKVTDVFGNDGLKVVQVLV